jgi:hypothetical protein
MEQEEIKGYCIRTGASGVPELHPCVLSNQVYPGLFVQEVNEHTWAYLQEGRDFFRTFAPAIEELIRRLEARRMASMMEIAYIDDQIEIARDVLQMQQSQASPCFERVAERGSGDA